jgi:hypothetical protein
MSKIASTARLLNANEGHAHEQGGARMHQHGRGQVHE